MAAVATLIVICLITVVLTEVLHLTPEEIVGGLLLQLVIWGWLSADSIQH